MLLEILRDNRILAISVHFALAELKGSYIRVPIRKRSMKSKFTTE